MGRIQLERLNNTRDLNGIKVDGGIISPGRLIRSGQLGRAGEEDIKWLRNNIDVVIDFRSISECGEVPDPDITGVEYIHIPVVEEISAGVSRDSKSDEEAFRMLTKDPGIAMKYMCSMYTEFVATETARKAYEAFIRKLFNEKNSTVLWHCTVGKDRAGFAAAIVLEMLGADRETIIADYLATNEFIKDDIESLVELYFGNAGTAALSAGTADTNTESTELSAGTADTNTESTELSAGTTDSKPEAPDEKAKVALRYLFGASREFLEAAYAMADKMYGSFSGYIRDGLHIKDDEIEAWKASIIE